MARPLSGSAHGEEEPESTEIDLPGKQGKKMTKAQKEEEGLTSIDDPMAMEQEDWGQIYENLADEIEAVEKALKKSKDAQEKKSKQARLWDLTGIEDKVLGYQEYAAVGYGDEEPLTASQMSLLLMILDSAKATELYKKLEALKKGSKGAEGGMVDVELHIEFSAVVDAKFQDAIHQVLDDAVDILTEHGVKVEVHQLEGSYEPEGLEAGVTGHEVDPGAEEYAEESKLTKEELQDAIEFLYTEQEASDDEAKDATGKERKELIEARDYIDGIRAKLGVMRDSLPGASEGGTSRKPLEPSTKTAKELKKISKRDFP